MLYNLPTFFEITTVVEEETNTTTIKATSLRENKIYFAVHKVYLKIAIDLIAYVVIIVLNTFIFIRMAHSTRLSKIPKEDCSDTRRSSVVSTTVDGTKYYATSTTNHTVYLDVPGRNSNAPSPRRVSRDLGMPIQILLIYENENQSRKFNC